MCVVWLEQTMPVQQNLTLIKVKQIAAVIQHMRCRKSVSSSCWVLVLAEPQNGQKGKRKKRREKPAEKWSYYHSKKKNTCRLPLWNGTENRIA